MNIFDSPKRLRVYIVGHTTIIRRLLTAGIRRSDADLVGQSDNAEDAISEIRRLHADFVVLALVLVSGTGFDVLKSLRGVTGAPATRVVLTARTSTQNREHSFRLGATHFLDRTRDAWGAVNLMHTTALAQRGHFAGAFHH